MLSKGLSIIIPTTNRDKIFLKTLNAVYHAVIPVPFEIIVINDSKTQEVLIDDHYFDKVKVVNNPRQGLASVRNFGVELALYNTILYIDDDILVNQNTIADMLDVSSRFPGVPLSFNWIYPPQLTDQIKYTQFGRYLIHYGFTSLKGWSKDLIWKDDEIFEPDLMASYFLLITKDIIKLIGGYNDQFPPTAEDYEFGRALKDKGIKGLVDPTHTVYHNEEDRVELIPWLQRKERGAATRRVSAALGYKEMELNPSPAKKAFYDMLYSCKEVCFIFLKMIPNTVFFDRIYFALVNRLLTAYLYHGYFNK